MTLVYHAFMNLRELMKIIQDNPTALKDKILFKFRYVHIWPIG